MTMQGSLQASLPLNLLYNSDYTEEGLTIS